MSGWISPRVPKLERTIRMRRFCSVNAQHEGTANAAGLECVLEDLEPPLQLELLPRLFAGFEQRSACTRSLFAAKLGGANGTRMGIAFPGTRLLPKAFPRQETVFEPGPRHLLKVAVGERVGQRGAHVLMGKVDARDPFIIGRKRYRHVIQTVHRQRMIRALDV